MGKLLKIKRDLEEGFDEILEDIRNNKIKTAVIIYEREDNMYYRVFRKEDDSLRILGLLAATKYHMLDTFLEGEYESDE